MSSIALLASVLCKKVNSALDNPISYFTASALDNRAGDISDLPDGIGNGIQAPTTRQSIAVSAIAPANQSQQSVLQLLR